VTDICRILLNKYLSLHILTINRVINLPTIIVLDILKLSERSESRKSDGAKRSGERALQKDDGAGGRGAGTERRAEVTEIGWSAERLFRRSRSGHKFCHRCYRRVSLLSL